MKLTIHIHLVPRSRRRSCTSIPTVRLHGILINWVGTGTTYLLLDKKTGVKEINVEKLKILFYEQHIVSTYRDRLKSFYPDLCSVTVQMSMKLHIFNKTIRAY
jgi:hypothetical protein